MLIDLKKLDKDFIDFYMCLPGYTQITSFDELELFIFWAKPMWEGKCEAINIMRN